MANRRMFSLKVIDTDQFLEMPISSRLLYYDLSMRADDDGFVESPKKILKMIGCAEDDLKLLCAKQYIIPFETGVCVIKHWNIHNLIRHDRYTQTECKKELSFLVKLDGKYEKGNVIPDDNQMAPQVRLGKVRLGKDSIGEDKEAYKSAPLQRFIVPTIEQIKEVMQNDFEAVKFFNYYESNGWMVGKNKMKKWVAAVTNWKSNLGKFNKTKFQPAGKGFDHTDKEQQEAYEILKKSQGWE